MRWSTLRNLVVVVAICYNPSADALTAADCTKSAGTATIGTVTLEDGQQVKGFLCEAYATKGAREITGLGSWRRFIKGG